MLLRQLRLMEAEDFWRQVKERDMAMMTMIQDCTANIAGNVDHVNKLITNNNNNNLSNNAHVGHKNTHNTNNNDNIID